MLQVSPNYTMQIAERDFEDTFKLKFNGPGLYTQENEVLLVVPKPPEETSVDTVWHQLQPKGTVYAVHVYDCPFEKTLFFSIGNAPNRN